MFLGRINFLKFRSNCFYSTLNSAQVAFANRIGCNQVSPSKLLISLTHPKLEKDASDPSEFQNFLKIGNDSLKFFAREYLRTSFPCLDAKYLEIGTEMFLDDKNVLQLARFLGIDAACGTDSMISRKNNRKKASKTIDSDDNNEIDFKAIHLDCFKALLGVIGIETGPINLRRFLDSRYFNNSLFNPNDLVRPLYPIPDLARIYPNLIFRLHQESGRLSSNSIFIVGVYADEAARECLGEGHGASQALAQHRAATEALRKIYLKEKRINQRPSDTIKCLSEIKV